jgi:uncharacterized membrane protein YqjE
VINDREILHGQRRTVFDEHRLQENRLHETNGRSFAAVINDLKAEGKAFVNTRLEMLKAEMNEKVAALKASLPMLVVGAVFALTAWLVLTAAIVCIIAVAFGPGMMSWFYATLIVGLAYLLIGGAASFFAMSEVKRANLKPERTLRVLKQDQVFLQSESNSVVNEVKEDIKIRRAA